MSQLIEQNYANHRTRDPYLVALVLGILISAGCAITGVWVEPPVSQALLTSGIIFLTVTLCGMVIRIRMYSLRVQDRIIRLETQLRLERVLPRDLKDRAKALTLPQLIALRFAADRDLEELVQKVLDDKITSGDAIKRMIKHWQADHLRV